MSLQPIRLLLVLGSSLVLAQRPHAAPALLHEERFAASDLEITGLVRGLAKGRVAYVRYGDLLKLPQVSATIRDDPDYPGPPLHVAGVLLETLATAVGALPLADLIDAPCADRYRSHFPFEYMAQHHPILVLKIDGKALAAWARDAHQYDPSPYVVMYQNFQPAFKVLTHSDAPQLPDNLLRLNFTTLAATYGPIAPRGSAPAGYQAGSPEQIGFTIAKQNCLRCHFMGESGGTKSGRSWISVGQWAGEQPEFFERYVSNPQKVEPHAHMEGSPQYDKPTLDAIAAYFRTFSDSPKRENSR